MDKVTKTCEYCGAFHRIDCKKKRDAKAVNSVKKLSLSSAYGKFS